MNIELNHLIKDYEQLTIRYDESTRAVWCYMNAHPRPSFTTTLIEESKHFQNAFRTYLDSQQQEGGDVKIEYQVLASQVQDTFNLGGDLSLFKKLILNKDRNGLLEYGRSCIDILYPNTTNYNSPVTTISLVEGTALGGGFESALSSNVVIVEKGSVMGFPEILFNLFPGMGAYSLLARRVGIKQAEKIILSGQGYDAEYLFDLGVIDILAEKGKGRQAVNDYIKKHARSGNGYRAVHKVRQIYNPISYKELIDINEVWVDTALMLSERDLKKMERIVKAQDRNIGNKAKDDGTRFLVRTKQDRRINTESSLFPFIDQLGTRIKFDRRQQPDRR